MNPSSSGRTPPAVNNSPEDAAPKQGLHAAHRTQRVRIRGLVLDPHASAGQIEVCVNDQADWDLIYKNPSIRVKCLVESCDTLLMAKRMSRSGLRFLAVRSGGCSHNLVEMRVERGEVEQDPSNLVGGGGPEGDEHRWMKGRLFKIAQSLGAEAVVEHSLTRADVFLPRHNLVLEYQRWSTDFPTRTAQRQATGAARTVWMFPWQPPGAPRTRTLKSFDNEVFEHGGIYVAVRNKNDRSELQRPWEDASQERTARLYASGSIAVFDPDRGTLIRKQLSLATVLAEIIGGDRVLAPAVVLTKSNGNKARRRVWALSDDLARAEATQKERRRATNRAPVAEQHPRRPFERKVPPAVDAAVAAAAHNPPLPVDVQASGTSAELAPSPPAVEAANEHCPAPKEAAREKLLVNEASRTARQPKKIQQPAPRGSWWKSMVNWFRRP
ncbi:hypothetical protein HQO24_00435 [Rhodococcus fascians]|uniref:hypothetical protein n=1 Tax=Rhodococcoides fascians TaxID=1828 RepID=UPI0012D32DEA|nr:hypothetical protein [Rhodococcus fascians]MBY4380377.1 hypothetical protein [Rhodococcus fascians]MBY4395156.1 hypothetical protein [Rhodococcus fascians]MBY4405103.1 hypothetical protein [Rhodococcus fascians]MBY4419526.1 hypothetical protein [Rhodococcus fascians]MBY4459226.1 hypothetical protein [Rhodococcus fascians]